MDCVGRQEVPAQLATLVRAESVLVSPHLATHVHLRCQMR